MVEEDVYGSAYALVENKFASLKTMLVQNFAKWLTIVEYGANSVAKKDELR